MHRTKQTKASAGMTLYTAPWTLDQIAGMVVGVGLVALAALAWKVDKLVAREQRKELGLCPNCGGIGCEQCRSEKGEETERNTG